MDMWQTDNRTPFAAFAGFERDHTTAAFWGVWIKAAFGVTPEGRVVWNQSLKPEIRQTAHEEDRDGRMILVEDSDLQLPKAQTDICLTGAARDAKGGSEPFLARAAVAGWSKTVQVHPARHWQRRNGVMPLRGVDADPELSFANAYGGTFDVEDDTVHFDDNPVGLGFCPPKAKPEALTLPRLTHPGDVWKRPGDVMRPISFSPLPRGWPERAKLAGTFDEDWMQTRSPLLPADHDPAFRQSVPADQRFPGLIVGGEEVKLTNILWQDEATERSFKLPKLDFLVEVKFCGAWQRLDMAVQTLRLKPGEGQFELTYAGFLNTGAAANDVKVGMTEITLQGSEGFAVAAEDVDAFHGVADDPAEEDEEEAA